MKGRRLRRVPVIDESGNAVGLVTMRDLLLHLYEEAHFEEGALRDYVFGVGYH